MMLWYPRCRVDRKCRTSEPIRQARIWTWAIAAAIVTLVMVLAGCGSTTKAGHAAQAATPAAVAARSYTDVQGLLAAMAAHGATCSDIALGTKGVVTPSATCSGGGDFNDTIALVFADHAAAMDYAGAMLSTDQPGESAGVVGSNWAVITTPEFAARVAKAVGGQVLTGHAAPSTPDATPAMTSQSDVIVFKVHGTGYPSVLYGTDSDSRTPAGGYGVLGDGVALPWSATMTYDSTALYHAVTAQLQGYGDISDTVTEVITTRCSNGSSKTERFRLASGHASGGYSIARAEYAGGDTGNATQAESDAGC